MFRSGKILTYLEQYILAAKGTYKLTPIVTFRILAGVMVASLLLPLPWFTLSDSGESIAGTRLLSYLVSGPSSGFIFSIMPVPVLLLFITTISITVLSLMTLADSVLNNAGNARTLSVLNIIAILVLLYAAVAIADPTRHAVVIGTLILPKWGLWLTFLSVVGVLLLSIRWTNFPDRPLRHLPSNSDRNL